MDKDELRERYRAMLPLLRQIAKNHGYGLGVHGTEQRDLDLIAIPWRSGASEPERLAEAIKLSVNGYDHADFPNPENKPLGRIAWSFYLPNTAGKMYLDLSIMKPQPEIK